MARAALDIKQIEEELDSLIEKGRTLSLVPSSRMC